jgi:hypothetical protein
MAKFSVPALALALAAAASSPAAAFVAPSVPAAPAAAAAQKHGYASGSALASAAVLEPPPLSPETAWGQPIANIRDVQAAYRSGPAPEFAPTISAKDLGIDSADTDAQLQYFRDNAAAIKNQMEECGAVIFRDFDLMKSQEGFQAMYGALGMKVCLDPLHSVSARPTVDGQKNSPVYEAVNKESRKNFFIGTSFRPFVGLVGWCHGGGAVSLLETKPCTICAAFAYK